MNTWKQIVAITAMNLKSVPHRLGSSSVVVVGIAGVVAVLVSILAMVSGITQMMGRNGREDRAIVVSTGASFEVLSNISREAALTIHYAPGVKLGQGAKPLASTEAIVIVRASMRRDNRDGNLTLRGVGPAAIELRPELKLVEGRMFQPALREVIVGRTAQRQFRGLDVGSRISLRGTDWTVVGVFESRGDSQEAGLLTGADTLQSAFRREAFQSVAVQLESAQAFAAFRAALIANPALAVDVLRESDYYAEQSRSFTQILSVVAYLIGGIMAVGAVFGALNAMYSAVSGRAVEIATLRLLGFGAGAVVASVLAEALLLAAVGGIAGSGAAWLAFNGSVVSTSAGGVSQLAVPLLVDPGLLGRGLLWACIIGLVGASLPAFRAARAPLAAALRGT
jgi:putative ABC transport system permease protein